MAETKPVEHSSVKAMSEIQRSEAQMRVAMKSPEQLRAWLEESGRVWLVFNAMDLVDALPYPEGVKTLMGVVACYRDHRSTIPSLSGETVTQRDPRQSPDAKPRMIEVPRGKTETLEIEELDRAIRYLITQATKLDPSWSINNPAR